MSELTWSSDRGRARVGVLLGRRSAAAQEEAGCQCAEKGWSKSRTGEYHVVLWEEVGMEIEVVEVVVIVY